MKKLVLFVCTMLTVITQTVSAAEFANISLESGYNNHHVVNGVAVANDVPFAGLGAMKSLKYADVYVGGMLIVDGSSDQSHWLAGVGKSVSLLNAKDVAFRGDATVLRHQTASVGIENSTEFAAKLALQNPLVTPYIKGVYSFGVEQRGYFFGAERVQKLPYGFSITPSVEWGRMTDYDAFNVKGTLSRPLTFAWGTVTPFADVGLYDNSKWSPNASKVALKRFENDMVYNIGLRVKF